MNDRCPALGDRRRVVVMSVALWLFGGSMLLACSDRDGEEPVAQTKPLPEMGALALSFDGNDDYATTGTAGFPAAEAQQTVSLWAKPQGGPSPQALVVLRRDFQSGVSIGFRDGVFEAWSIVDGSTYARADAPLDPGWHHLAYVFDAGEHRLYVNGQRVGSGSRLRGTRTPTSCWVGSIDGLSDLYFGEIDELRIWNGLRSDEQITLEAAGMIAGDASTLVAYFPFDELTGDRAFDRSGLGNDASLGDGVAARAPNRVPSEIPTP